MIGFGDEFERQCEEYLTYLYALAKKFYNDCPEIDMLVQDTLTALIVKVNRGETVESPKGYLSAVMKNKYNGWLRDKYKKTKTEYYGTLEEQACSEEDELEQAEHGSALCSRAHSRSDRKRAEHSARYGIVQIVVIQRSDQRGTWKYGKVFADQL